MLSVESNQTKFRRVKLTKTETNVAYYVCHKTSSSFYFFWFNSLTKEKQWINYVFVETKYDSINGVWQISVCLFNNQWAIVWNNKKIFYHILFLLCVKNKNKKSIKKEKYVYDCVFFCLLFSLNKRTTITKADTDFFWFIDGVLLIWINIIHHWYIYIFMFLLQYVWHELFLQFPLLTLLFRRKLVSCFNGLKLTTILLTLKLRQFFQLYNLAFIKHNFLNSIRFKISKQTKTLWILFPFFFVGVYFLMFSLQGRSWQFKLPF